MGTLNSLNSSSFPPPLEPPALIDQLIKYALAGLEAEE
jgi:hypothetical protein